jgi:hypothetical protein
METGTDSKERADAVLSVRFTPAEMDQLRGEAERVGMPLSAYVRRYVLTKQTTSFGSTQPMNASSDPHAAMGVNASAFAGPYLGASRNA